MKKRNEKGSQAKGHARCIDPPPSIAPGARFLSLSVSLWETIPLWRNLLDAIREEPNGVESLARSLARLVARLGSTWCGRPRLASRVRPDSQGYCGVTASSQPVVLRAGVAKHRWTATGDGEAVIIVRLVGLVTSWPFVGRGPTGVGREEIE